MLRLISKCMTSQTGKQIITMHILPKISRTKSNRAMKLLQVIEYNLRNAFLQKPCSFSTWPINHNKNLNIFSTKRAFNMK